MQFEEGSAVQCGAWGEGNTQASLGRGEAAGQSQPHVVVALLPAASGSAPASSNALTASTWPAAAAVCNGVPSGPPHASRSAPAPANAPITPTCPPPSKGSSMCTSHPSQMSNLPVVALLPAASGSAPASNSALTASTWPAAAAVCNGVPSGPPHASKSAPAPANAPITPT